MKIAKTNYSKDPVVSPEAVRPVDSSGFLDGVEELPLPKSSDTNEGGIVASFLDRMAEYVEPLEEVGLDLSENFKSVNSESNSGKNFIQILSESNIVVPTSGIAGIKDQVSKLVAQLTATPSVIINNVEAESQSVQMLYAESKMVPVSSRDDVGEIRSTIERMQCAISALENNDADELPLPPVERSEPKTKAERLLQDLDRIRPIWRKTVSNETHESPFTVYQKQSELLMERIRQKIKGFTTAGNADTLDSSRSSESIPEFKIRHSKLRLLAQDIVPDTPESLMSSKIYPSPKGTSEASASIIEEEQHSESSSFKDEEEDPEIIDLTSAPVLSSSFPFGLPPTWVNQFSGSSPDTQGEDSSSSRDKTEKSTPDLVPESTEEYPKHTQELIIAENVNAVTSAPFIENAHVELPAASSARKDRKRLKIRIFRKKIRTELQLPGMRISRHKSLKKSLRFYKAAFDFVDPFHVVSDPSFIEAAVESKFNLKDDLANLLSGRVTPMVTSCVMAHLRRNGRVNTGALFVGKACFRLKCYHDEKNPLPAADCIVEQLRNENERHFFIATQDERLRTRVRVVPGSPVLSIAGNMLMLESPSEESREAAQHRELKRRLPKLSELTNEEDSGKTDTDENGGEKKKRKRRIKGANPLSCLPKKVIKVASEASIIPSAEPVVKRVRSKRKLLPSQ